MQDIPSKGNLDTLAGVRARAKELRQSGARTFDITMHVLAELSRAGVKSPTAESIVRELPSLSEYSVLDDYEHRMTLVEGRYGDALAEITVRFGSAEPPPTHQEDDDSREGKRFAEQLKSFGQAVKGVLLDLIGPEMSIIAAEVAREVVRRRKEVSHAS